MNWNIWIRQFHRWVSIAFTLTVIANFIEEITVKHHSHTSVGLVGMQWYMQVLTEIGHPEVAYAVATQTTLERLVDFSTSEEFGTHAYNVNEGHVSTIGSVGEARWTYAVSKLAGEHMTHAYHDELGLPTVTVRPFNVFGPGQIGGGAIRAFIEAALAGEDLVVRGDGSQIRAWCYVDDMVDAVLLCLERPEAVGQSFNIGNARSAVTIFDLAQRVKRITGCSGEIRFAPLNYVDVELRIPNVGKAREQLGFEARVELDEGLAQTIGWYRARKPALA